LEIPRKSGDNKKQVFVVIGNSGPRDLEKKSAFI